MYLISLLYKPMLCFLFLTVFAHFVSPLQMDAKLSDEVGNKVISILRNYNVKLELSKEAKEIAENDATQKQEFYTKNLQCSYKKDDPGNDINIIRRSYCFRLKRSVWNWIKEISKDIKTASYGKTGLGVSCLLRSRKLQNGFRGVIYIILVFTGTSTATTTKNTNEKYQLLTAPEKSTATKLGSETSKPLVKPTFENLPEQQASVKTSDSKFSPPKIEASQIPSIAKNSEITSPKCTDYTPIIFDQPSKDKVEKSRQNMGKIAKEIKQSSKHNPDLQASVIGQNAILQTEAKTISNIKYLPETNSENEIKNFECTLLSKISELLQIQVEISDTAQNYAEQLENGKKEESFFVFETGILQPRTSIEDVLASLLLTFDGEQKIDRSSGLTIREAFNLLPTGDIKAGISLTVLECQHLLRSGPDNKAVFFHKLSIVLHETNNGDEKQTRTKNAHIDMTTEETSEKNNLKIPKQSYSAIALAAQLPVPSIGNDLKVKEAYDKGPKALISYVLSTLGELRKERPLKFGAVAQFLAEDSNRHCNGKYIRYRANAVTGPDNFKDVLSGLSFNSEASTEVNTNLKLEDAYKRPNEAFTVGYNIKMEGNKYELHVVFCKTIEGAVPNPNIQFKFN